MNIYSNAFTNEHIQVRESSPEHFWKAAMSISFSVVTMLPATLLALKIRGNIAQILGEGMDLRMIKFSGKTPRKYQIQVNPTFRKDERVVILVVSHRFLLSLFPYGSLCSLSHSGSKLFPIFFLHCWRVHLMRTAEGHPEEHRLGCSLTLT
jgi:hypothetical protein